ncbi:ATP-dependent helicase HrpB [Paenibacillus soyae]|uniref:ATP-dependent helicase HrpB n=1 Tax=Paenibacillus soyae TaxID=2969249 RepID=A0A9X2S9K3_9BACL|nr:ATP-dependent helicase HrpB [Paenibacillus soyae]MCR2805534.1 ATP-dependent helicase HrpB [Paenibacillus soyae]
MKQLPIDNVLPELLDALARGGNAVLVAETGAGKTTRVPLALMEQKWLGSGKIIMLEPRRLAARSAAAFMAGELGEKVGERVGYRVRLDAKVGPRTVIEVVTEGVLTRMLQSDPALEGVAAVLFDEFHERHLHGDLGLALCLQAQSLLREDLRLLVMSATLDAAPVAEKLGQAPVIHSRGRTYPVETRYAPARHGGPVEAAVGQTLLHALREEEGDALVFLPGVAEIRRTARWLAQAGLPAGIRVAELHGSLPLDAQSSAIAPCADGERKIVLATSIAESSLTVQGVRIVVDSGLMRVSRFSPRTGLSRLETVPVSQASADQRRGRAGRLAPGVCYRLWTEEEHRHLPEQGRPEIMDADLSPLALELAIWGVRDPLELEWMTPPPKAAYDSALELLRRLLAVDEEGKATERGAGIARLGVHPRLGAMLGAFAANGAALRQACELAALLSERDLLGAERNVDMSLRLDALRSGSAGDMAAAQRVKAQAEHWRKLIEGMSGGGGGGERSSDSGTDGRASIGAMLAVAYPDRVAQRRPDGRYVLASGRGAVLPELQPLSRYSYLVVCEMDDAGPEGRIRLAAAIEQEELERWLPDYLVKEEAVEWDAGAGAVRSRKRLRLGALVLSESPLERPDPEKVADALIGGIRQKGLAALPLGKSALALLSRMRLMRFSGDAEWPDVSEEALLDTLEQWLKPHIYGIRSLSELGKLPMGQIISGMMNWKQSQELDEQVPTHIQVPSGSRIPVDYSDPASPVLAVRLQELFGLRETPRLVRGRLPVTLHLLSPSQRPVQVTQDLASFWEHAYFEVKKDLKGRYPKHYWPDNPYEATATNRAKPRT